MISWKTWNLFLFEICTRLPSSILKEVCEWGSEYKINKYPNVNMLLYFHILLARMAFTSPSQNKWLYFEKQLTGSRLPESLTSFPVSPPSLSPAQYLDTRSCLFFTFSFEDILLHISLVLWYWMTVDSEIFMPKSKAPKMDDLDYSKWT